jgi:hypothetical protein
VTIVSLLTLMDLAMIVLETAGKLDVVEYLADQGAPIDTKDDSGWSPLYVAVRLMGMFMCCAACECAHSGTRFVLCLHRLSAVSAGHEDVVRFLLGRCDGLVQQICDCCGCGIAVVEHLFGLLFCAEERIRWRATTAGRQPCTTTEGGRTSWSSCCSVCKKAM